MRGLHAEGSPCSLRAVPAPNQQNTKFCTCSISEGSQPQRRPGGEGERPSDLQAGRQASRAWGQGQLDGVHDGGHGLLGGGAAEGDVGEAVPHEGGVLAEAGDEGQNDALQDEGRHQGEHHKEDEQPGPRRWLAGHLGGVHLADRILLTLRRFFSPAVCDAALE